VEVSVVVPARDASATIGGLLEALAAQEPQPPAEVVVVDDGSRDDTVDIARAASIPVRLVRQSGEGPGAARNCGVAAARGELLAFTDADCRPAPGWLAAGMAAAQSADLVQGPVRPDPAARSGPFDRTLWVTREVGLYETANLFVTRSLFERVGGFQTLFEPIAGKEMAEDVWFGWRARRTGARTTFCQQALVHHAVFPRGPAGYVMERRRLVHFPAIARHVPELRESMFFGRAFLSSRSAAFDAAVAGVAAALLTRRGTALLAAAPYARMAGRRALRAGPLRSPYVAAVDVAADLVGAAWLVRGSIEQRSPVL
jgi:hypothetical protein